MSEAQEAACALYIHCEVSRTAANLACLENLKEVVTDLWKVDTPTADHDRLVAQGYLAYAHFRKATARQTSVGG
jgi:hypothetical protein